ncbi:DUF3854 domain-containing protein [Trichocoleus sp. FACHB-90]|uniref:plasmid replication protein, CyRepA1 family n=1 Tax=Cyanophyceae TaxID=3028117 RepID=UPI001687CAF7|nr:plasmid replication protein, CyRepA1 family [Trichocoleus sp. FACHB-90]MBD1930143.1 DUF3854 domain-containing protein [Trichocoleus sp. FACHB-90]
MTYPDQIEPKHFSEWLDSAVDEEIIALNVRSLSGDLAYRWLLTDITAASGKVHPDAQWRWAREKYGHIEQGGWGCSGIDPLNNSSRMLWGCFKPNRPRLSFQGKKPKPVKYEHPPKQSTRAFFLAVPLHIWEEIASRYHIPLAPEDQQAGFWHWVWQRNIPIVICEGVKKAACLLSAGYAALALPGITGGCRTKDEQGNKVNPYLIPELKHFATSGREIYICFDHDAKQKTVQNVNWEINKLGTQFIASGCKALVIQLPGPEKGVDDFVVARGKSAFNTLYQEAPDFSFWQAKQLYTLTYTPTLRLNQRYLENVPFPKSGLVCIKSAKGTGKTSALEPLIASASRIGRRTLVITHRTQLGRAICAKLGIDWIEDMRQSNTRGLLGYGLCIDSLHPSSAARFNPEDWREAIIVLDEIEQVIWHALNSSTCYENRVAILETLAELIHTVTSSGGLVIAQDADLSDLTIDYLKAIANIPIEPWVVVNDWKPQSGWDATFYATKDPSPLFAELNRVAATGPTLIVEDSQKVKGKWSCRNTETRLQKRFPLLRILRIDSETTADPSHPAYGCVERLNEVVRQYDIIICSPTIGTGVSIDVRGYFKGVFGIFQGVIPTSDVLQALARLRDEKVPRYIWTNPFGLGKISNGSANYKAVIKSQNKIINTNIRLLKDVDFDIDSVTNDPINIRTWAKMAARINAGMWDYRQTVWEGLKAEGHRVKLCRENELEQGISELKAQQLAANNIQNWDLLEHLEEQVTPLEQELEQRSAEAIQLKDEATLVREQNRKNEAEAIANAFDIPNETKYQELKEKRTKTSDERYAEQKHQLKQRYGVPITAELKLKDDDGWYAKLRLHYYLTHDPELVKQRDRQHLSEHLARGNGKVCPQDIKLLTSQVEALSKLGLTQLFDPDREWRGTDEEVEKFASTIKLYSRDIKDFLGLTIHKGAQPMEVVQIICKAKLGFTLKCIRQERTEERDSRNRRKRIRVYQFQFPTDGRQEIFDIWLNRDTLAQEKANCLALPKALPDTSAECINRIQCVTPPDKYIDISPPVPNPSVPNSPTTEEEALDLGGEARDAIADASPINESGFLAAEGENIDLSNSAIANDPDVLNSHTTSAKTSVQNLCVGAVVKWLQTQGTEKLRVLEINATTGYVMVKSLLSGLFTHTHISRIALLESG